MCLQQPLNSENRSLDGRPRYIFSALLLICTLCLFFMRINTNRIVNSICASKTSFASLGGKRQRNILTFNQLIIYFSLHVFFYNLDTLNIYICFKMEHLFGSRNIFLITILPSVMFKLLLLILLPLGLLLRTKTTFPQFWTECSVKKLEFTVLKDPFLIPRRTSEN